MRYVAINWRSFAGTLFGLFIALAPQSGAAQELYYSNSSYGTDHIALWYTYISWSSNHCSGAAFEICAIKTGSGRATPPPGVVLKPFDNSGGDPADSIASNISRTGPYTYWLSQGGEVLRKHEHTPPSLAPIVISAMESAPAVGSGVPAEIATDENYVYWIENSATTGKLFRAPIDGGAREHLIDTPDGPAHNLQVDGAGRAYLLADVNLIVCCSDVLHQITPDTVGSATVKYSAPSQIDGYSVYDGQVFVAHRVVAGGDLLISGAPVDMLDQGGAWTDYYNAGAVGPPAIREMVLTRTDVFWHETTPTAGGSIVRMPRAGGAPVAISSPVDETRDLQALDHDFSQDYLMWIDAGDIYRLTTSAGPLSRDLDADDITLEVVQSIQNSLGDIPLAAGKPTFVRAFARLASSSDGATSLDLFPAVTLTGTQLGAPLPGSPLRPLSRSQPLEAAPVDRASTAGQFLFELPESWTHGTGNLTAMVDPRNIIFETDETNNSTTRTVSFDPLDRICIDIIPVQTTLGVANGAPLSTRARNYARARSVLPTDRLKWIFRGGSPKSKPWSGDPYNFSLGSNLDELLFNFFMDFNTSGTPSHGHGLPTIRAAAVAASGRYGISSGAAGILLYPSTVPASGSERSQASAVMAVSSRSHRSRDRSARPGSSRPTRAP